MGLAEGAARVEPLRASRSHSRCQKYGPARSTCPLPLSLFLLLDGEIGWREGALRSVFRAPRVPGQVTVTARSSVSLRVKHTPQRADAALGSPFAAGMGARAVIYLTFHSKLRPEPEIKPK